MNKKDFYEIKSMFEIVLLIILISFLTITLSIQIPEYFSLLPLTFLTVMIILFLKAHKDTEKEIANLW